MVGDSLPHTFIPRAKQGTTQAQSPGRAENRQLECLAPTRVQEPQLQVMMSPTGALSIWQMQQGTWGSAGVWVGSDQPRTSLVKRHQPHEVEDTGVGTRVHCISPSELRMPHWMLAQPLFPRQEPGDPVDAGCQISVSWSS